MKREVDSEAAGYRQGEGSYEEGEDGEAGEAEEQFLHRILSNVLGQEAEGDEAALSPAQESQFASQLMEASDEQELARILGGIINTVGRTLQGVRGAVNSPQGRALIEAVTPVAQAVLAGESGTSLVAGETGELDQEKTSSRWPAASSSSRRPPHATWRRHRRARRHSSSASCRSSAPPGTSRDRCSTGPCA